MYDTLMFNVLIEEVGRSGETRRSPESRTRGRGKLSQGNMVTLVKTKQGCLKKLFETVKTTRRISEFVSVISSRPSDHQ